MTTRPIVLPAIVYDTFELSAYVFNGIGAYKSYTGGGPDYRPLCLSGHAGFATVDPHDRQKLLEPFSHRDGVFTSGNDRALVEMVGRKAAVRGKRVSWAAYCKHRNIIRGK